MGVNSTQGVSLSPKEADTVICTQSKPKSPQAVVQCQQITYTDSLSFSGDARTMQQIIEIKAFLEQIKSKSISPSKENKEKFENYIAKLQNIRDGISTKQYKKVAGSYLYDDIAQALGANVARDLYKSMCNQRDRIGILVNEFVPTSNQKSQERYKKLSRIVNDFDENLADLLKSKIENNDENAVINLLYASENFPHDLLKTYPDMLSDLSKSKLKQNKTCIINILYKLAQLPLEEETKNAIANSNLDSFLFIFPYGKQVMGMKNSKTQEEKIAHAVDLLRSVAKETRVPGRIGFQIIDPTVSLPNGKVDLPIKMGHALGDCGFVASMQSIANRNKGRQILDSMLTLSNDNKFVNVKFKNDSTSYKISTSTILGRPDFVTGDGDVRAIEAALDTRVARECKEGTYPRVDIRAIYMKKVFQDIVGNGHDIFPTCKMSPSDKDKFYDSVIDDFNNANRAYGFGIKLPFLDGNQSLLELQQTEIVSEDGSKKIKLLDDHAYAILRKDDEYIYLNDPAHGNTVFTISHEKFKKFNPIISYGDLND